MDNIMDIIIHRAMNHFTFMNEYCVSKKTIYTISELYFTNDR